MEWVSGFCDDGDDVNHDQPFNVLVKTQTLIKTHIQGIELKLHSL